MARIYKKRKAANDPRHCRAAVKQRKWFSRQKIAATLASIPSAIKRPTTAAVLKKRGAERQRRYYSKTEKRLFL